MCKVPDSLLVEGNKLLYEVMSLLGNDYLSAVNEVLLRLSEFKIRLSCLSFGDSVDLVCVLKRLENCQERLLVLFTMKKPSTETLWELVEELKSKLVMVNMYNDGRKLGRKERITESARFGERVLKSCDSVQFSSGRLSWGLTI